MVNEELTKKDDRNSKNWKSLIKWRIGCKANNVEMQGIPVSENENVEETALKMLKKIDARMEKTKLVISGGQDAPR